MSESEKSVLLLAVRAVMSELSHAVRFHGMPMNTTKRTFRDLFEAAADAGLDVDDYRKDYHQFDVNKGA